jgi:hypothetical protein
VSLADAAELDGIFEIEISDLRPAARPRQHVTPAGARLSTRLRGRRFVASLLVMLLVLLDLAPGTLASAPGALAVTLASAQSVAPSSQPGRVQARPTVDAAQFAPANVDSVWPALWQRPLQLPTLAAGQPCPNTPGRAFTEGYGPGLGTGPVYLLLPGPNDATLHAEALRGQGASGAGWSSQQVRWVVHPLYQGPVLVRGARIDSAGALRFNGGLDQTVDAALLAATPALTHLRLVGDSSYGAPWIAWVTYLRVRDAGCYAVQVDGLTFSETIVFRVTLAKTTSPGER